PELKLDHLLALARLIAQSTNQEISAERPILSATLPGGERVQVIFPPAAEEVCLSVRKPSVIGMDLDAYESIGGCGLIDSHGRPSTDICLTSLYERRDYVG